MVCGYETKFFKSGGHACFQAKAALARAHSKTLRVQGGCPMFRQVL
jgi:hypothetical protein